MKKLYFLMAGIVAALVTQAQYVNDYLKAADQYYAKGDYYSAAQYYEKYLETGKAKAVMASYAPYTGVPHTTPVNALQGKVQDAVYNLAQSYRQLHYPVKAVGYYEKVVQLEETAHPLALYYYAVSLRALGKYEAAERAFNQFLDNYKTDDEYQQQARREVLNLHFIDTQLRKDDLPLYGVEKISSPVNVTGASYAPCWMAADTLLFTSTRTMDKEGYVNQVYQAVQQDGEWIGANPMPLLATGYPHQGVVSYLPGAGILFFTGWVGNGQNKKSVIYRCEKMDSGWSKPLLLDSTVNNAGYNARQPFVMADGKHLLFASDRPGGYGGFDLWMVPLSAGGTAGEAENLGAVINTEGDEQSPFYHTASGTLVFANNSRTGMGGFDLFYSKGDGSNWSTAVNLGYPVNSIRDDLYFISRGSGDNMLEDVLLSSDRSSDCCLELFTLTKQAPAKQVYGLVVACGAQQVLAGARVEVVDLQTGQSVWSGVTGLDGSYTFTVDAYRPLKAVASLNGFENGNLQFNAPVADHPYRLDNPPICLSKAPPEVSTIVVLQNVYYDFDKATLREESHVSLDELAGLLNDFPGLEVEIGAHTDNLGTATYNLSLSEARAQSVVDYLVAQGIAPQRLQPKGYGATQPVAPNQSEDGRDNPAGRQLNRRTEFKVLKN